MKYILSLLTSLILSSAFLAAAPAKKERWKLVWSDEFNGSKIESKHWSKCERGKPDWSNTMSDDPSLFALKNGNLVLRGKVNPDTAKDPSPVITGGVQSRGKVSFCYGRIDVRAKFTCAQGAWPALWLLPDIPNRVWPDDGEIDIMEHLNFDNIVYQTLHSRFITKLGQRNPRNGGTGKINRDDYNLYSVIWTPDKITCLINEKETLTYPRLPEKEKDGQWPYHKPFYILLDMQLGGNWVGKVNQSQLPVEMWIDYVRIYKDANAKYKQVLKIKK
ncbi:MAG: glycoside hydrolase family 16 protein [Opitutales bacterium]|nr:glycoside hydrolase family 16 protein [Opitutales bacterium]